MRAVLEWLVFSGFAALVIVYFAVVNAFYLLTSLVAFRALRRYSRRIKTLDLEELLTSAGAPPITVIAPAYNEAATCVEATRALLTLNYREFEIIVVNDGSKDATLQNLTDAFQLVPAPRAATADLETKPVRRVFRSRRLPNLWVLDKENGGKADALNAGLNFCRTPLFCALDADSLLERDALTRIVRPFLEDSTTVAAGGIIRIVNGCRVESGAVTEVRLPKGWLARFQVLEYLRAFLAGRVGWSALNATLIISGAFGLFRRALVVEVGGYATDTVGEDMELVVRLHRHCRDQGIPYRIEFVPDPVAWTECPESLRVLARQRDRWQRGLTETLLRHRHMLLNPRYGVIGMLAYPYFFFLETFGAAIEVAGYAVLILAIVLGRASGPYAVAFLMVAVVLGIALSVAAVGLEELTFRRYPRTRDLLALFGLAVLEGFGYRQLSTLWRMRGLVSALRGKKGWGEMTRKGFGRAALVALLCQGAFAAAAAAQSPCPPVADSLVNAGWMHYRAEDIAAAGSAFAATRASCPSSLGALIGLGYVALRRGDVAEAGARFAEAVRRDSAAVDALFGMGLLAWRRDEPDAARRWFGRVTAIVPGHAEANAYLAQLGRAPQRPPLRLADTVVLQARTNGDRFEVPSGAAWNSFYVKGVNLGAALPGRFPSEFPDSATYAAWIGQMVEMGANAVRVYTIHPPWFYQALLQHNTEHPDAPLRLIHGVWTELPPGHDFADPAWNGEFLAEARRVVDVIHGRADLPRRPGHASGFYTADVSAWTLAYVIGREWEPYAVAAFDSANPGRRAWSGRFLRVAGGTATDVWLTQVCDTLIAYETGAYGHQRPVAYTSWPTLDPLTHATEASVAEEKAMRRRAGERRGPIIREYDNDLVAIDPSLVHPTEAFRAGFFASYHAYPYYPEFMVLGGGYEDYLARLKAHHAGMPILILEYGVPTGPGVAHVDARGRHQGGHAEAQMAATDADLTSLLASSGMAGGALFAWIDEWFKRNWVVIDLEIPAERMPLWLSRMNAEEQFGVYAMEPAPRLAGNGLRERLAGWRAVPAVYPDRLRAFADEAYLHLLFEPEPGRRVDSLLIGLDIVDPGAGSFRWPGRRGEALPFGIEFVVVATPTSLRVLADPAANPFRVERRPVLRPPERLLEILAPPPGFFTGPYEMDYNLPMRHARRDDGRFDTLRVVTNRRRIGRDSVEYAAAGYERGALPPGPEPDGFWEVDSASGAIELRIPWNLINVADPSSRAVLSSARRATREFMSVPVPSIGIAVAARTSDGAWHRWPAAGTVGARFTWSTWDEPQWRARRRPVFGAMREAFGTVDYRGAAR